MLSNAVGVSLAVLLMFPPVAFSEPQRASQPDRPIAAAAEREAARLAASSPRPDAPRPTQSNRGWISRHPALFGALVGAGAGVVAGAAMENELICSGGDEDCLIYGSKRLAAGAAMGAGIGALIGVIVGAAR